MQYLHSMDQESNESSYKVSKYNSAIAQLMRIDSLWKDAHSHSRSGQYDKWNADLDKVWAEIAGDLDKKKGDPDTVAYNEFTIRLAETGALPRPVIIGFERLPEGYSLRKAKQFQILLEKEIWLRQLQNKLGKGTAYADELEDDLD